MAMLGTTKSFLLKTEGSEYGVPLSQAPQMEWG